jgi:hypothetical protein
MFHPDDNPMERGWVGRVDGDRVLHLAAQTLQSFFLGGGGAREHAEYPLAQVTLLVPVLYPPTVRLFDAQEEFAFANATAVAGPGAVVRGPAASLTMLPRVAAVIGADQQIGGYSLLAEWRAPGAPAPKDRDFALVLGPVVVTEDELAPDRLELAVRVSGEERLRAIAPPFDWERARSLAAAGTILRPGDVLAAPAAGSVEAVSGAVELDAAGIGVLQQTSA